MPHLWLTHDNHWRPAPLAGSVHELAPGVQLRAVGAREWVALARPEALAVNGSPLRCGIHALRDRDELRLAGGERVWFSTERLAQVVAHASDAPMCCPRCRQSIARDTLVVACPACGAVHHQDAELGCWTYSATCALCSQLTALDAGYRWTPEEL